MANIFFRIVPRYDNGRLLLTLSSQDPISSGASFAFLLTHDSPGVTDVIPNLLVPGSFEAQVNQSNTSIRTQINFTVDNAVSGGTSLAEVALTAEGGSRVTNLNAAIGVAGDDTPVITAPENVLFPAVGGGTVVGTTEADIIFGSPAIDQLSGGGAGDEITAGGGNDIVNGGGGSDRITGGSGNDILTGGTGPEITTGAKQFGISDFGTQAGGWVSQDAFPRLAGDVDGDGQADIVGFGSRVTFSALSDGEGGFQPIQPAVANFAKAQGWTSNDTLPRLLGDVDGDGIQDVFGFGASRTFTALGQGDGTFGTFKAAVRNFTPTQGWNSDDEFPRVIGDVNGDGRDDIIGFGGARTFTALASASGDGTFEVFQTAIADFSKRQGWTSNDTTLRLVGDVNGDGRDDLIGFGGSRTFTALAEVDGTYTSFQTAITDFTKAQGWTSNDKTPRVISDVNGDGLDDIVGFGGSRVLYSLSNGDGTFGPSTALVSDFTAAQGWTSQATQPRTMADLNGDGIADIVGFGDQGVQTRLITPAADTFVFADNWGNDRITDFKAGDEADKIDFSQVSAFANAQQVLAATTDTSEGARIAAGSNSILLEDIVKADLLTGDFLFG